MYPAHSCWQTVGVLFKVLNDGPLSVLFGGLLSTKQPRDCHPVACRATRRGVKLEDVGTTENADVLEVVTDEEVAGPYTLILDPPPHLLVESPVHAVWQSL